MNWKLAAFATVLALAQTPAYAQENDEALRAKVNAIFADLMVEGAPGAGVIVAQNGEPLHELYYGEADLVHSVPIGPDTVFHVASVSKQFTAYAINRLALEGKIDLDTPVEQYLTRWQLPESKFDAGKVTVRRLLSHTAGLSLPSVSAERSFDNLPTLLRKGA